MNIMGKYSFVFSSFFCFETSPAEVRHTDPGLAQTPEAEHSAAAPADAQTGPAAVVAVRSATGCTARQRGGRTPEGAADGRTRRSGSQRRTHAVQKCWTASRQGRLQGRPPRPLRALVAPCIYSETEIMTEKNI